MTIRSFRFDIGCDRYGPIRFDCSDSVRPDVCEVVLRILARPIRFDFNSVPMWPNLTPCPIRSEYRFDAGRSCP
eukprot:3767034-Pyramimonas_sp.AAC.1